MSDTTSIEWRPVVGFEGQYEVSGLGKVRSMERRAPRGNHTVAVRARLLRQYLTKTGRYPCVYLCKHGKARLRKVHQLVADAFIGPRAAGMDIDHINRDRTDNRRCNLRHCSRGQNNHNSGAVWGAVRFRGVRLTGYVGKPYQAAITHNGVTIRLGTFVNAADAARAYDAKATELLGEYASLNFPLSRNLKRLLKVRMP